MFISRSQFWQPFLLSILAVSVLSSKALHLFEHIHSVPRHALLLYLPTFFIQDALFCIAAWLLLHKTSGVKSIASTAVVGLLACITLAAASSQIGFYFVTGSEIRWNTAKSVGNDPEGRKLMLSGLKPVLVAWAALVVAAWLLTPRLYNGITHWLQACFDGKRGVDDGLDVQLPGAGTKPRCRTRSPARTWTIILSVGILGLWIVRPSIPYGHMSGTLAIVLLQVFIPTVPAPSQLNVQPFPFPELLEPQYWEAPHGHFPGWAPNATAGPNASGPYPRAHPWWTAGDLPAGFRRFKQPSMLYGDALDVEALDGEALDGEALDDEETNTTSSFYNPVTDPLRISNMDLDVLEPLKKAVKDRDIPITHVVLVLMESARKDIFPFKSGSRLHEKVVESHDNADESFIRKLNERLSHMTPTAEKLTGQSSGFNNDHLDDEHGLGGINVEGVLTGSSLSFKSAVMEYCGVEPLPVNFMAEATSEIYQPCFMQVLDLFNQLKDGSGSDSMLERKWKSVFAQSITTRFDKQNVLNENMGFNESISKETLIDSKSKYFHAGMEKINYFGFPEPEVYPYMRDAINDAVENKTRLFLSHFTSTTHHPWGTPNDFTELEYYQTQGVRSRHHDDMNAYLNAVRYVDSWLGDVMDLLNDSGIANETLVVLVGDHGQAFVEDSPAAGTYQNSHISNLKIPLVFHHPLLPRMQVEANTTSLSIIPTILDLLVQTHSLNDKDSDVALDLMNEYEGQSLIRPYRSKTENGRQAWNFNLINPGGEILSVGSAVVPYRLILPLRDDFDYKFIDMSVDPEETASITEWEPDMLVEHVRLSHSEHAAQWVAEAEKIGRWWVAERMRLWDYHET